MNTSRPRRVTPCTIAAYWLDTGDKAGVQALTEWLVNDPKWDITLAQAQREVRHRIGYMQRLRELEKAAALLKLDRRLEKEAAQREARKAARQRMQLDRTRQALR